MNPPRSRVIFLWERTSYKLLSINPMNALWNIKEHSRVFFVLTEAISPLGDLLSMCLILSSSSVTRSLCGRREHSLECGGSLSSSLRPLCRGVVATLSSVAASMPPRRALSVNTWNRRALARERFRILFGITIANHSPMSE